MKDIYINVEKVFLTKSLLTHLPNGQKETKKIALNKRESLTLKLIKIDAFIILTAFLGGGSRRAQDLDIDMLHCSFLDDKIEIIKKIEKFNDFCLVCEKDEGDIRYYLKKLKNLRNNLAHVNHMRANFEKWDDILVTIKICRIFTREMRKLL